MIRNFSLKSDSYKMSHYAQYRPGTIGANSYIEARTGGDIVFFGLQGYIRDYLEQKVTNISVSHARSFCSLHGVPFYEKGWRALKNRVEEGKGLPIEIYSVDEGTVMPSGNVQVQIRSTDDAFFWLPSWLETQMLRSIWYPSTVATKSRELKLIIKEHMELSCDSLDGLDFMLQDFGARGVSSGESAAIGGAAHLVNFKGSDTMEGIAWLMTYYDVVDMPAFSVPASEHSTMTSWGKDLEAKACENMLDVYRGNGGPISVVSDSYDIFNCTSQIWGTDLKDKVKSLERTGDVLVVRPDSGDLVKTPMAVCELLMDKFGFTVNEKGFRVLPPYLKVLQGDGLNKQTLTELCDAIVKAGLSLDNFVFGMGGGLLQDNVRDDYGYAMKCSAVNVNGVWQDAYKDPLGGSKTSKKGILAVYEEEGVYYTVREEDIPEGRSNLLQLRYKDGVSHNPISFEEVRDNAKV